MSKTVLVRVKRDINNILRVKMPNVDSAERWAIVYDTSAIRLDNWLGKPMFNKNENKKKK